VVVVDNAEVLEAHGPEMSAHARHWRHPMLHLRREVSVWHQVDVIHLPTIGLSVLGNGAEQSRAKDEPDDVRLLPLNKRESMVWYLVQELNDMVAPLAAMEHHHLCGTDVEDGQVITPGIALLTSPVDHLDLAIELEGDIEYAGSETVRDELAHHYAEHKRQHKPQVVGDFNHYQRKRHSHAGDSRELTSSADEGVDTKVDI